MPKEIDFFYLNNEGARDVASAMESRMGITPVPLKFNEPYINSDKKFIVFNGDGYQHHLTRKIVADLFLKRGLAEMPPFSYIHIDGHDDIAPEFDGDDNSSSSFVLGIKKDIGKKVFLLEEGLTGESSLRPQYITVKGPEEWGFKTDRIKDKDVYVSIDLDVLDFGAGIHHLFPQKPIGFTIKRLIWNLNKIARRNNIIGADLVGFSPKGARAIEVEMSLNNIALITKKLVDLM